MRTLDTLDSFTRAYIECALWSSTAPAYGVCLCCGKAAVLDRLPESEYEQTPMCSADGCGVREMNYEPPIDANYSASDLAEGILARMVQDCAKFQAENREDLAAFNPSDEKNGQNFWLNRNGHGSGFWDDKPHAIDGMDEMADRLSDACKACGECNLYVGDDGKIYATS